MFDIDSRGDALEERRLLAALGDPYNIRIVDALLTATEPLPVSDVVDEIGAAESTTYRKVQELVDIGILDAEREDPEDDTSPQRYSVNRQRITVELTRNAVSVERRPFHEDGVPVSR